MSGVRCQRARGEGAERAPMGFIWVLSARAPGCGRPPGKPRNAAAMPAVVTAYAPLSVKGTSSEPGPYWSKL